mmetsp:Transcript_59037/g.93382  ORF Transcript_59037/g.93382 Transcript_59037/m.93382 type:complete len:398 (+) Transcript_59037:487-1680(+)
MLRPENGAGGARSKCGRHRRVPLGGEGWRSLCAGAVGDSNRWKAPEGFESHEQTPLQRRSLLRAAGRWLRLAGGGRDPATGGLRWAHCDGDEREPPAVRPCAIVEGIGQTGGKVVAETGILLQRLRYRSGAGCHGDQTQHERSDRQLHLTGRSAGELEVRQGPGGHRWKPPEALRARLRSQEYLHPPHAGRCRADLGSGPEGSEDDRGGRLLHRHGSGQLLSQEGLRRGSHCHGDSALRASAGEEGGSLLCTQTAEGRRGVVWHLLGASLPRQRRREWRGAGGWRGLACRCRGGGRWSAAQHAFCGRFVPGQERRHHCKSFFASRELREPLRSRRCLRLPGGEDGPARAHRTLGCRHATGTGGGQQYVGQVHPLHHDALLLVRALRQPEPPLRGACA